MRRWIVLTLICMVVMKGYAMDCYFSVVKDNCWSAYDVNVMIVDSQQNKQVALVPLPKGTDWARIHMACKPKQTFRFLATYSPEFWAEHAGKKYLGRRTIALPTTVQANEKAWHVPYCFSSDFGGVPVPPKATKACQCDWSKLPPVSVSVN